MISFSFWVCLLLSCLHILLPPPFPASHDAIKSENIELKKLVYLYLINYAKTQPDLTLLAVNTFVKDANDPNPLIRALAVRTMGCIRVEKITEYLCEPLRKALRDEVYMLHSSTSFVLGCACFDPCLGLSLDRWVT